MDNRDNKEVDREVYCPICKKIHQINRICPVISYKKKRYVNENTTFPNIMGNIVLECLKQGRDFSEILFEIAYDISVIKNQTSAGKGVNVLSPQLIFEYFAGALNIKNLNKIFFKSKNIFEEELLKYINEQCVFSDKPTIKRHTKSIESIEIEIDFNKNIQDLNSNYNNKQLGIGHHSTLSLIKYKDTNGWAYELKANFLVRLQAEYINNIKPSRHYTFWIKDMFGCGNHITLMKGTDIRLRKLFNSNVSWIIWAQLSSNPELEEQWLDSLWVATQKGTIRWSLGEKIITFYSDQEICIDNSIQRLYILLSDDTAIYFEPADEKHASFENLARYKRLIKAIYESPSSSEKWLSRMQIIAPKQIYAQDIIVVARSLICREKSHMMTVYRGIIKIQIPNGSISTVEVFVGYCIQHCQYYMFNDDLKAIMEIGRPLCQILYEKESTYSLSKEFHAKAESLLKQMGYNVQATSPMTQEERQAILLDAIKSKKISQRDLINHIEWNIHMHEEQTKFGAAVNKWAIDLHYIKYEILEDKEALEIRKLKATTTATRVLEDKRY